MIERERSMGWLITRRFFKHKLAGIAIGVLAILAFTFMPSKTMEQVLNKVSTDNPGKGETPERKE